MSLSQEKSVGRRSDAGMKRGDSAMKKSEGALKKGLLDVWSLREKLCLASAVLRSGDQNWVSVSRSMKPFAEPNRPPDWFSQKNCALQYAALLENIETPRRKKRMEKGEVRIETPGECILRMLTQERVEELKVLMAEEKAMFLNLRDEIIQVKSGKLDENLPYLCQQIENEKKQQEQEAEKHAKWLREREEKQLLSQQTPMPVTTTPQTKKRKVHRGGHRRNSNQSDQSSGPETIVETPRSDVNVVTVEASPDTKHITPSHTPTSPLLTSLLKSPTPTSPQAASILHTAITSQRASQSPTITSLLLSSSPGISNVVPPPPSTVSTSLNDLVSNAIAGSTEEHAKPVTTSPSAGAPTLSMLLELPHVPGEPLPELPSAVRHAPSQPPPPYSVAISQSISSTSITTTSTPPVTTTVTVKAAPSVTTGEVCHPEHQEMRVRRETETDEPIEVVELDLLDKTLKEIEMQQMEVIIQEVCPNADLLDESVKDISAENVVSADHVPQKNESVNKALHPSAHSESESDVNISEKTSENVETIQKEGVLQPEDHEQKLLPNTSALEEKNTSFSSDQYSDSLSQNADDLSIHSESNPELPESQKESVIPQDESAISHEDSLLNNVKGVPAHDSEESTSLDTSGIIYIDDDSHPEMIGSSFSSLTQAEVLEVIGCPTFKLLSEQEIKKEKDDIAVEDNEDFQSFSGCFSENESDTRKKDHSDKELDHTSATKNRELCKDKESIDESDQTENDDENGHNVQNEREVNPGGSIDTSETKSLTPEKFFKESSEQKEKVNATTTKKKGKVSLTTVEKAHALPEKGQVIDETLPTRNESITEESSQVIDNIPSKHAECDAENSAKSLDRISPEKEEFSLLLDSEKVMKASVKRDRSQKANTDKNNEMEKERIIEEEVKDKLLEEKKEICELSPQESVESITKKTVSSRESTTPLKKVCRGGNKACGKCVNCFKKAEKHAEQSKNEISSESKTFETKKLQKDIPERSDSNRESKEESVKVIKDEKGKKQEEEPLRSPAVIVKGNQELETKAEKENQEVNTRYQNILVRHVPENIVKVIKKKFRKSVTRKSKRKSMRKSKEMPVTSQKNLKKTRDKHAVNKEIGKSSAKTRVVTIRKFRKVVKSCKGGYQPCGKCKICLARLRNIIKWKAKIRKEHMKRMEVEQEKTKIMESQPSTSELSEKGKEIQTCDKNKPCGKCKTCMKNSKKKSGQPNIETEKEQVAPESVNKVPSKTKPGRKSKKSKELVKEKTVCNVDVPCGNCAQCSKLSQDKSEVEDQKESSDSALEHEVQSHLKTSDSESQEEANMRKLRKGTICSNQGKPCGKCKKCLETSQSKIKVSTQIENQLRDDSTKLKQLKVKDQPETEQKSTVEAQASEVQSEEKEEVKSDKVKRSRKVLQAFRRKTRRTELKTSDDVEKRKPREEQDKPKTKDDSEDAGKVKNEDYTKETSEKDDGSDVEEDDDKALSLLALSVKHEAGPSSAAELSDGSESLKQEFRYYSKKRSSSVTESSAPSPCPSTFTEEEREHKAWKKAIMLLHSGLSSHKFASLFLRPITDDLAPGYSNSVYMPMDLQTIKKNIENGLIRTTTEFQREVMLMFQNAIMYNRSTHIVYEMAREMQEEAMQHIQDFINTQKLVQAKGEVSQRRETRTMDSTKQYDYMNISAPCTSLGIDLETGGPFEHASSAPEPLPSNSRKRKREKSPSLSEHETGFSKRKRV